MTTDLATARLTDLEISGYRGFDRLVLPELGHVNLIVGPNNAGKTSFLEAVALFAAQGSPQILKELLASRDETSGSLPLAGIGNLFGNRLKDSLLIKTGAGALEICLVEDPDPRGDGPSTLIQVHYDGSLRTLELSGKVRKFEGASDRPFASVEFVRPNGLTRARLARLWDDVLLNAWESIVIDCLSVFKPTIHGIFFVEDELTKERTAVARIEGVARAVPFRSLGDGGNRVLGLAVSALNARGGFLLIDEFENGLHHEVQLDVWRFLFRISEQLNVQIFATTHSTDSLYTFSIAAEEAQSRDGRVTRLVADGGSIRAVQYSEPEMKLVRQTHLEIR